MRNLYEDIVNAKANQRKLLAILIDPDKIELPHFEGTIGKINRSPATHVFVGGSVVNKEILDDLVRMLKRNTGLPIILFPGSVAQISPEADAILFLSLISGRNPEYLIGQQVDAVPVLKKTKLEIIPTGYILIESGCETAVERVSKTVPMDRNNPFYVWQTAQAGVMLGKKLIYLEAGSGAEKPVPTEMIKLVAEDLGVPLIVGGGIKTTKEIEAAYEAGADMVVIGTAFEMNIDFFD